MGMDGAALDRIRALPCWQGGVTAEPLKGGLSNESWKVADGAGAGSGGLGVAGTGCAATLPVSDGRGV